VLLADGLVREEPLDDELERVLLEFEVSEGDVAELAEVAGLPDVLPPYPIGPVGSFCWPRPA